MGHSQAVTARRSRARHAALGATVTLALITALTAALLAVGIAPAASPPGAQDRAGAFFSAAPACAPEVGAGSPCTRPGSVERSARIAVGCCVAAKPGGWRARLADERGSVGAGADDAGPRLIYEHNPKHGPVARQGPRGEISRAPRGDCQSMLECSTLVKPGLRTGIEPETGLEVIFRRHRVFENTEWWHGYVPGG